MTRRLFPGGSDSFRRRPGRSPRPLLFLAASTVLASGVICAAGPGAADFAALPPAEDADRPDAGIEITPRIRLMLVEPGELLAGSGGPAVSVGTWRSGAPGAVAAPFDATVARTVESVWRAWVDERERTPSSVEARYELISADGTPRAFSSDDGGTIPVSIRPLPPVVVGRSGDRALVEGGLVLELDLGHARSAGRYSGTITVTLEHF